MAPTRNPIRPKTASINRPWAIPPMARTRPITMKAAALRAALGHDQPAGQVEHQPAGHVGRPLAENEARDELGFLIQGDPEEHVDNVAPLGPLGHGQPGLFLGDERPDFVAFDVLQGKAPASADPSAGRSGRRPKRAGATRSGYWFPSAGRLTGCCCLRPAAEESCSASRWA